MAQTPTARIHNRNLTHGTEISITGEPGRFKFIAMFPSDNSITCYGGAHGRQMFRSFRLDRVRRVHNKKKMR